MKASIQTLAGLGVEAVEDGLALITAASPRSPFHTHIMDHQTLQTRDLCQSLGNRHQAPGFKVAPCELQKGNFLHFTCALL